ncbi:10145_t:CDS:1 [Funneliformis geosporum]|uniref:16327_t:CDS:1 n=1 Tax=Funneliformis geosporum TaxID=1117311 RepID=A0A9W4WJI5_9GLOM|nr:16327_t:CDS:1 [Funneliformis geosporum]CAI2167692.1 10145_t:CDS:1 [Funneliformis geosporum]
MSIANSFLKSLCEESHHLSRVNSQIDLLRFWKYFMEITSYILSNGSWIIKKKNGYILADTQEVLLPVLSISLNYQIGEPLSNFQDDELKLLDYDIFSYKFHEGSKLPDFENPLSKLQDYDEELKLLITL